MVQVTFDFDFEKDGIGGGLRSQIAFLVVYLFYPLY